MDMPMTSLSIHFENSGVNITAWLSSAWDYDYSSTERGADAYGV